jgi:RNA polymerase sigma factor (sigma-70 family)
MTNEDRFKFLYQKYYWRIVKFYVRSFRLREEDAQELAQDAFVRFYQAMDEYRGDAEWAFFETIARNVAYNKIRSQNTAKRSGGVAVGIDDPRAQRVAATEDVDPGERQEKARQLQQLREAIAELPDGQRQCVQLRLDEFKYDEIARFLRISIDAVKSRLRDARKLLRAKLGAVPLPEDEA